MPQSPQGGISACLHPDGADAAIPALFQYSYLSSEIKGITADLNVFMGELSTRVEEEYGGNA